MLTVINIITVIAALIVAVRIVYDNVSDRGVPDWAENVTNYSLIAAVAGGILSAIGGLLF